MAKPLQQEYAYFLANQAELVMRYPGRVLVIKDEQVLGDFDTELEAIQETSKNHRLGTFLVQRVELDSDSYTQVFHSRVAFR